MSRAFERGDEAVGCSGGSGAGAMFSRLRCGRCGCARGGCADGHCHILLSQSLASSVAEDASRRAVATQSADTRERAVREREARVSEMVAEAEARMASLSRREAAVVAREEVRWMMANLQCCVWLQHVSTCVVVLD